VSSNEGASFYPYSRAGVDSLLEYSSCCGSPPPIAEEVAVKVASKGIAKNIEVRALRLSIGSGSRPLVPRLFGFIAFILWLFYMIMYIAALPMFTNLLVDCNNLINSAVSKLEDLNSTLRETSTDPFIVDPITKAVNGIIGALRIIRLGNYLYMVVEILRFIIVLFILHSLNAGNYRILRIFVPIFFTLEVVGRWAARFIASLGADTAFDLLLSSRLAESPFSYHVAEYLVRHMGSFSLTQRVWESANLVLAIITIGSNDSVLFIISFITAVIVIAFSWLAYYEMKMGEEYESQKSEWYKWYETYYEENRAA